MKWTLLLLMLALAGCQNPSSLPTPSSPFPTPPAGANVTSVDPQVDCERANQMLSQGRLGEAESLLQSALTRHPNDWNLLAVRSQAAYLQKDYGSCVRDLSQALVNAPQTRRWSLYYARARAEMALKKYADVSNDVTLALQGLPAEAESEVRFSLHRLQGMARLADLDPQGSLPCLEKARRLKPQDPQTLAFQSFAFYQLGRATDYQKGLELLKKLDPGLAGNLQVQVDAEASLAGPEKDLRVALQSLREGDSEGALAASSSGLKSQPENAPLLACQASALQRLGRFQAAAEAYTRSYLIQPRERLLLRRAECFLALGKKAEARRDYESYLAVGVEPEEIDQARRALSKL